MAEHLIAAQPRLLDRVRDAIRLRHYSYRTEQVYLHWIKRYIWFHDKRHPADMGAAEVTAFLSHLARDREVSASTQNQALSSLLFLYGAVLELKLPWMNEIQRAKRPVRVPVVLAVQEVRALLGRLHGTKWLMASLLYGAGLRLRECLKLRIKDVDFDYQQITVRDGKGGKDRVTMLPAGLREPLRTHLVRVKALHEQDWRKASAGWKCRSRSIANIPMQRWSGAGSMCFRRATARRTRAAARSGDTTCSTACCRGPSPRRRATRISPSRSARIRCGIRSRRICSARATTFARCRSCSGTLT